MKKIVLSLVFLLALIVPRISLAEDEFEIQELPGRAEVWIFHSESCPYSADARAFLEELKEEFPELVIREYEVDNNESNATVFSMMNDIYNVENPSVPTFFIGNLYVDGFGESIANGIRDVVERCIASGCQSPAYYLQIGSVARIDQQKETEEIEWQWVIVAFFVIVILVAVFWPSKKKDKNIEE